MATKRNHSSHAHKASTKGEYEGDMERKLKDIGKTLDEMVVKADDSKARSIEILKDKKANAENSLNEIKAAGQEAWSELKQGLDSAFDDLHSACNELKNASEKAMAKFNNKDQAAGQH